MYTKLISLAPNDIIQIAHLYKEHFMGVEEFSKIINDPNIRAVEKGLRGIAAKHGLGIAMIVLHLHGLQQGHIPLEKTVGAIKDTQVFTLHEPGDKFRFVNVPVRGIRQNQQELQRREIMDGDPDPSKFVYHEDGLVGMFTFTSDTWREGEFPLTNNDQENILESLQAQGLIRRVNVDNRQIDFKDKDSKQAIMSSKGGVFVRTQKPLPKSPDDIRLFGHLDTPQIRSWVHKSLKFKMPCNYCSAPALNPKEATVNTISLRDSDANHLDFTTMRNYQLGYTFAPFGDPRTVMHFLAWDFPHLEELINNMDPQSYSFSDLIKLIHTLNKDLEEYAGKNNLPYTPLIGICNHWAGNSIYHMHYQFFRGLELALLKVAPQYQVSEHENVKVERLNWPMPAYMIVGEKGAKQPDLMYVADKTAEEWGELNEKEHALGNGIMVAENTQNISVTEFNGKLVALFIPRWRSRIDTKNPDAHIFEKGNLAILETMGYFIIDQMDQFQMLQGKVSKRFFEALLKKEGLEVKSEQIVDGLIKSGILAKTEDQEYFALTDRFDAHQVLPDEVIGDGVSVEIEPRLRMLLSLVCRTPEERNALAQSWLEQMAPDEEMIAIFETNLKAALDNKVVYYERLILSVMDHHTETSREVELKSAANRILDDPEITPKQLGQLVAKINSMYRENCSGKTDLISTDRMTAELARRSA